jgi:hypothetical protein
MEAGQRMTVAAAVLIVAAATVAHSPAIPKAVLQSEQILLSLPASVLNDAAMEKQLTNGLTTVIITSIEGRIRGAATLRGAVRVEIRYELWEEKFLVGVVDASARRQSLSFATFDKLVAWWSSAALRLAAVSAADAPAAVSVKTEVVPFSAAEEADAQRWLMRSMTEATGARPPPREAGATTSILDVIIGTGVRRKPIRSWRWTVPLSRP